VYGSEPYPKLAHLYLRPGGGGEGVGPRRKGVGASAKNCGEKSTGLFAYVARTLLTNKFVGPTRRNGKGLARVVLMESHMAKLVGWAMVVQVIGCATVVVLSHNPQLQAAAMIWMTIGIPCQFGFIINS